MTRLHPDDIKLLASEIVRQMRQPVEVGRGVPLAAIPKEDLEARLRSEGRSHRLNRRKSCAS